MARIPEDGDAIPKQDERHVDEVRSAPIARRRTLQYSKTPDRHVFMIDGQVFNDDRVDQTVKLGNIEQVTWLHVEEDVVAIPARRHAHALKMQI
jgi:hypothetical protein